MNAIDKAMPRPWSLEMPKGYITSKDGDLIAVVCDNVDTGRESMGDEPSEHNSYLIQKAVNEYDALNAVAEAAEKLRLAINPLLVELPEKSVVNGEDNFPFRLRILKLQTEAETALSALAVLRAKEAA